MVCGDICSGCADERWWSLSDWRKGEEIFTSKPSVGIGGVGGTGVSREWDGSLRVAMEGRTANRSSDSVAGVRLDGVEEELVAWKD